MSGRSNSANGERIRVSNLAFTATGIRLEGKAGAVREGRESKKCIREDWAAVRTSAGCKVESAGRWEREGNFGVQPKFVRTGRRGRRAGSREGQDREV